MVTYHLAGVSISSTELKGVYLPGTDLVCVGEDVVSGRVGGGQVPQQPQQLSGAPTGPATAMRPTDSREGSTSHSRRARATAAAPAAAARTGFLLF